MTMLSVIMALMAAAVAFYLGHALMRRQPDLVVMRREKMITLVLLGMIPTIALGVYGVTGHPDLPDMPLATRPDRAVKQAFDQAYVRMANMADRLESEGGTLAEWERLGQIAVMLRDAGRAEKAARHLVAEKPDSPDYLVMLIQILIARANGQMTPETQKYLDHLQKVAPNHPVAVMLLKDKKPIPLR